MSVTRVGEPPRVTKPFCDEWRDRGAGREGRRRSESHDVRLTMGGEPTFVSIDDFGRGMALRRGRSDQAHSRRHTDPPVARSLRAGRAAALRPGQMVSGRVDATLGLCALLARRRRAGLAQRRSDHARTVGAHGYDPKTHSASPSVAASVVTEDVQPLYEDPVHQRQQGLIPDNFDPSDPQIDDPHERARILKLLDSQIGTPRGFVLPISACTGRRPSPAG